MVSTARRAHLSVACFRDDQATIGSTSVTPFCHLPFFSLIDIDLDDSWSRVNLKNARSLFITKDHRADTSSHPFVSNHEDRALTKNIISGFGHRPSIYGSIDTKERRPADFITVSWQVRGTFPLCCGEELFNHHDRRRNRGITTTLLLS